MNNESSPLHFDEEPVAIEVKKFTVPLPSEDNIPGFLLALSTAGVDYHHGGGIIEIQTNTKDELVVAQQICMQYGLLLNQIRLD